jgi:hypothetical protein
VFTSTVCHVTVCAKSSRQPSERFSQSQSIQQLLVPFAGPGLRRVDLTLPRSRGHSFNVGNIGHGGNRRCRATAGTARETAGKQWQGKLRRQRQGPQRESRRYWRNRKGQERVTPVLEPVPHSRRRAVARPRCRDVDVTPRAAGSATRPSPIPTPPAPWPPTPTSAPEPPSGRISSSPR